MTAAFVSNANGLAYICRGLRPSVDWQGAPSEKKVFDQARRVSADFGTGFRRGNRCQRSGRDKGLERRRRRLGSRGSISTGMSRRIRRRFRNSGKNRQITEV